VKSGFFLEVKMPIAMFVGSSVMLIVCVVATFVYKDPMAAILGVFFLVFSVLNYHEIHVHALKSNPLYEQVDFVKEIPQSIDVKDAFNTKEKTEYVSRGVGVGVGVGLAEVELESKEQFLEMIPSDSIIYSTLQQRDKFSIAFNYLAFMADKPGVFVYEQVIYCPADKERTVMGMDSTAEGKVFAFGADFLKCKYTR
jgi:hypothetical protein